MTYEPHGNDTSAVEVTNVSKHGLWLLLREKEFFLPYEHFPWFKNAPIGKVLNVELPSLDHLYWPELDVDLEVDVIVNPERYPLVGRVCEGEERYLVPEDVTAEYDQQKVDDTVLALLRLTLHGWVRAWKTFDFDVLDRLFQEGYILDPKNKNKSVVLTGKGLARSAELFKKLFGTK